MPGNFSLLALAILLMELYTGESFAKQQKKTSGQSAGDLQNAKLVHAGDDALSRLLTLSEASKWVNDIQNDPSELIFARFATALEAILIMLLGRKRRISAERYETVVLPLQEELQTFMGQSR
jgi:hypothetical protein